MPLLPLVYAPHPIFKKKAEPILHVDEGTRQLVDDMLQTMYVEKGVGLGANMVGILKRIAVVDIQKNGEPAPYRFINPEITWSSEETQTFEEASLSYPGISAEVTRPKAIKLAYLDYNGDSQTLEAEGFLATVIQHEVDYLNGTVFLDYLSKMKRDMLLKKMQKHMKQHPPHVHTGNCCG